MCYVGVLHPQPRVAWSDCVTQANLEQVASYLLLPVLAKQGCTSILGYELIPSWKKSIF